MPVLNARVGSTIHTISSELSSLVAPIDKATCCHCHPQQPMEQM
jgi:hypothetical protein